MKSSINNKLTKIGLQMTVRKLTNELEEKERQLAAMDEAYSAAVRNENYAKGQYQELKAQVEKKDERDNYFRNIQNSYVESIRRELKYLRKQLLILTVPTDKLSLALEDHEKANI